MLSGQIFEANMTVCTVAMIQVDDGDVLSAVEQAVEHDDEMSASVTI
jgi:hypothetical protein